MTTRFRAFQPAIVAATLTLGAVGLFTAGANSRVNAPTPSVVATVDMERLMNGLAEVRSRNEELDRDKAKKQSTLDEMSTRLKKLNADLEMLSKETIDYRNKKAEAFELEEHAQSTKKIYQQLIALDSGELIRAVYEKCRATIAKVAEKDGYTLILLDDRSLPMPRTGTFNEMNSFILNKRVLFGAESVDITDRVMTEMNNEYGAPAKNK